MNTNTIRIQQLVIAAVCLALCMVLPFLTGQIPEIGSALSPMHIPVLLAGFICGPWWALAVGAVAPVLYGLLGDALGPTLATAATAVTALAICPLALLLGSYLADHRHA